MGSRDRRPTWRKAVYAPRDGMTNACRVLLLRMFDDMQLNGIVSTPRSKLAADLGVAPARVSEGIKLARALGFLDQVRRARPNVTAVYQATIPTSRGTASVPHSGYAIQDPARGTASVPQNTSHEVRMYPTQEAYGTVPVSGGPDRNVGSDEKRMDGNPIVNRPGPDDEDRSEEWA